jgi:hypothetical protein
VHLQKAVGDLLEKEDRVISVWNCAVPMRNYSFYLAQPVRGPVVQATSVHRRRVVLWSESFL